MLQTILLCMQNIWQSFSRVGEGRLGSWNSVRGQGRLEGRRGWSPWEAGFSPAMVLWCVPPRPHPPHTHSMWAIATITTGPWHEAPFAERVGAWEGGRLAVPNCGAVERRDASICCCLQSPWTSHPGRERTRLSASFTRSWWLNGDGGGWCYWVGWRGSSEEVEPASVCLGLTLGTHTLGWSSVTN